MSARFSVALAFFAIALGTIPIIENMNLLMRPLLGLVIFASLFHMRDRMHHAELTWIGLLSFYMLALCLSAVGSAVPDAAGVNVGRQAFVILLSIALVILFRDPDTRFAGLRSAWVICAISIALTLWVYGKLGPIYGYGYEATRIIKSTAAADYGIGLNILSYLLILAVLCVRAAYRLPFVVDAALLGMTFLCVMLLGSRAPLFALVISWVLVSVIRRLWNVSAVAGYFAVIAAAIFTGLCVMIVADYAVEIRELFGPEALREISVGRTDMWVAGLRMWAMHPFFGWGPESWKLLMLEFLPGTDERFLTLITNLETGSFHNGFITIAAERGTLGLLSAALMQLYLFGCAINVARHRDLLGERDRPMAALLPMLVLFIFLRSLAESSGLFGNANATADYMTFLLSSYVVALQVEVCRLKEAPREALAEEETPGASPQPSAS